uniref:Uncharacterized protein n=1 Tax=Arundo donax TaxID=35708 RepID=A0A0A9FSQ8_ARUDO
MLPFCCLCLLLINGLMPFLKFDADLSAKLPSGRCLKSFLIAITESLSLRGSL